MIKPGDTVRMKIRLDIGDIYLPECTEVKVAALRGDFAVIEYRGLDAPLVVLLSMLTTTCEGGG